MITVKCVVTFNHPVKDVWDIVTNNLDYSWRSDISKINIIDDENFVEVDINNYLTNFKITNKDLYKKYQFEIMNKNITGSWMGIFKELDKNQCQIEFTEMIEVSNLIMKLFGKRYLKKQQKRYIKDLTNRLNIGK